MALLQSKRSLVTSHSGFKEMILLVVKRNENGDQILMKVSRRVERKVGILESWEEGGYTGVLTTLLPPFRLPIFPLLSSLPPPSCPVALPTDPLETDGPSLEHLGKTRPKPARLQRGGRRVTVKPAMQPVEETTAQTEQPDGPQNDKPENVSQEKLAEKLEEKLPEKVEKEVEEKAEEKVEEKVEEKAEEKAEEKVEEKAEEKVEEKVEEKQEEKKEEEVEQREEPEESLEDKPERQPGDSVMEKCEKKSEEEQKENKEEKGGEEKPQEQPAGEVGETLVEKAASEEEAVLKEKLEVEPQKTDQPEEVRTSPAKEEENRAVSPQTNTLAPSPLPEPSLV